jgi:hypothetical protein
MDKINITQFTKIFQDTPILYALIFVILLVVGIVLVNKYEPFSNKSKPSVLDNRPILWFVSDNQSNTRKWADFSTRNSKQNNRGYTELSYKTAQQTQGKDFQILHLNGRDEVIETIKSYGGIVPENVQQLPPQLWRAYVRTALLANAGGLYVDGDSVLFIGPAINPFIKDLPNALFGINPDEPIASTKAENESSYGPSPFIGYAQSPNQSVWKSAESFWLDQFKKGPSSYTALVASRADQKSMDDMRKQGVQVVRQAEGNRKKDNTYLNLYDLFARSPSNPDKSMDLNPVAAYVCFDSDALERSAQLSYILKLSPTQLDESDFLFVRLVKKALNA